MLRAYHLLRQMVRAGGVGVHAGAAFDRIQAGEDFNIGGVVAGVHRAAAVGAKPVIVADVGWRMVLVAIDDTIVFR